MIPDSLMPKEIRRWVQRDGFSGEITGWLFGERTSAPCAGFEGCTAEQPAVIDRGGSGRDEPNRCGADHCQVPGRRPRCDGDRGTGRPACRSTRPASFACEAGIDGGTARTDGGAHLVRHRQNELLQLFRGAKHAAARDQDLGRCQFRPVVVGWLVSMELSVGCRRDELDGSRIALGGAMKPCRATCDFLGVGRLHGQDGVAGIRWSA